MLKTRGIQLVLGALGLGLLLYTIHKVGLSALKDSMVQFGPGRMILLILIYGLSQMLFCAAWYVIFSDTQKKIGFRKAFQAYLAGDALNMTIPSGNLAGEPVKVLLVQDALGANAAISSVTIYKFSDFLSMTIFLLFGWLLQFRYFSLPGIWNIGAAVIVGGMSGASVLFFFLQKKGVFHPAGKWLHKLGVERVLHKLESAHWIDRSLSAFYSDHPARFLVSLGFNFLAWCGGVWEILIFLKLAGLPSSFPTALTIETFSLFLNNIIFFVPARLGAAEAGRVIIFRALGYSTSLGLSYGIIRRIRELTWVTAGLVVLMLYRNLIPEPARKPALHHR